MSEQASFGYSLGENAFGTCYSPHVYGPHGNCRGRWGVVIMTNPERDRWHTPFDASAVETIADHWAVVDDYGRLVRVERRG